MTTLYVLAYFGVGLLVWVITMRVGMWRGWFDEDDKMETAVLFSIPLVLAWPFLGCMFVGSVVLLAIFVPLSYLIMWTPKKRRDDHG